MITPRRGARCADRRLCCTRSDGSCAGGLPGLLCALGCGGGAHPTKRASDPGAQYGGKYGAPPGRGAAESVFWVRRLGRLPPFASPCGRMALAVAGRTVYSREQEV